MKNNSFSKANLDFFKLVLSESVLYNISIGIEYYVTFVFENYFSRSKKRFDSQLDESSLSALRFRISNDYPDFSVRCYNLYQLINF